MYFSKPPLKFGHQLEQLISRGMQVGDKAKVISHLSHISYYRLGTYWWSFIDDHKLHTFKKDTNFEQVVDLYVFDRELRLLMMDAIERIEISLRTQWAFHLSHKHGTHAHLDSDVFSPKAFNHSVFLSKLKEELRRTNDKNIKRQCHKYDEFTPAIWICCEVMSFGWLSKAYDGIKRRSVKMDIAKAYQLNESVLSSFLHHLTTIRNICAHHSRLWNRESTFKTKLPRQGSKNLIDSINIDSPNQLYNTLVMTAHLLEIISPDSHWKQKLYELIQNHQSIDLTIMGFPQQWWQLPVWRDLK